MRGGAVKFIAQIQRTIWRGLARKASHGDGTEKFKITDGCGNSA